MGSLLPPAEPVELPEDLAAFLLSWAAVSARDEDATREALAHAATELPEREGHRVARTLHEVISPGGRDWLRGLLS